MNKIFKIVGRALTKILQGLIRVYSYIISPFLGRSCRYHPTCSAYAHKALDSHGAAKGLALTIRRIFSCHPWCHKNYHDPVPERFAWKDFLGYKRPIFLKNLSHSHKNGVQASDYQATETQRTEGSGIL